MLSGKLEVDTIVVDSPAFRVTRLKDGSLNLPFMKTEESGESEDVRTRYFNSISVRGASILMQPVSIVIWAAAIHSMFPG